MSKPWFPGTLEGFFNISQPTLHNDGNSFRQVMTDYVGRPITASPLSLVADDRGSLVPINGGFGTVGVGNWARATDFISPGLRNNPMVEASTGIPDASVSMGTLLARTNPSRPDYVPLTLLQDLVEIPRQLADVGRLLRKGSKGLDGFDLANQHLGIQFGWKPLIQDVKDLLDLQMHIHKRKGELQRLYQAEGLKRRLYLGRWVGSTSTVQTVSSDLRLQHTVRLQAITIAERWGTVRWKPSIQLPWFDPLYLFNEQGSKFRPNDEELIQKAKRTALGFTSEGLAAGVWDLIPWTWLTDWFADVGEFAMQYSNTIPATPTQACIMTESSTEVDVSNTQLTFGYTGGGGIMTRRRKDRYTGAASSNVHLPFINGKRLSILSALFVQRFKGAGRY